MKVRHNVVGHERVFEINVYFDLWPRKGNDVIAHVSYGVSSRKAARRFDKGRNVVSAAPWAGNSVMFDYILRMTERGWCCLKPNGYLEWSSLRKTKLESIEAYTGGDPIWRVECVPVIVRRAK